MDEVKKPWELKEEAREKALEEELKARLRYMKWQEEAEEWHKRRLEVEDERLELHREEVIKEMKRQNQLFDDIKQLLKSKL